MRMLLTSNGITNPTIRQSLLGLLGKPFDESRVVVILDAFLPFPGDKRTMIRHVGDLGALGWAELDVLSLFNGPRSLLEPRLLAADVVYCFGGSNHWLAHAWRSTGYVPLLQEILDEKVYVGMSAGSMIFSRLHEAAVEAEDDHAEIAMFELDSVGPALPLFDWFVSCHLGAEWREDPTDEWVIRAAERLGGPLWAIDDDTALLVRGPDAEPEVISEGRWLSLPGR